MTGDDFHDLMASVEAPMAIATTASGGDRAGCLVGFWTQSSIDPPRVVVFLSVKNRTFRIARGATHIAVHLLADAETDRDLAERFGGDTGDDVDVDKFSGVSWHDVAGVPVLDACGRWFVGRVIDRVAPGDHVGFVLEPTDVSPRRGDPDDLTLEDVEDIDPGHAP